RSHLGPHHAAPLLGRLGVVLDLVGHAAGGRLGRHLEHVALDVHLPAVIQAAQAALLIAAEHQRSTAVRTVLVHHTDTPIAVAKDHEVFAKGTRLDRRAARLGDLPYQAYGRPIPSHELPHGGFTLHQTQQFVFFLGHHGNSYKRTWALTNASVDGLFL